MRKLMCLGRMFVGGLVMASGCGADPSQLGTEPELVSETSALSAPVACGGDDAANTRFYVPPMNPAAITQIAGLVKGRQFRDAARLVAMGATPQAVWFTKGSPAEAEAAVHDTMVRAAREHRVPVLVAYDLPFRDCAQYSSGGAVDSSAYAAWIEGFARGIGNGKAVVLLEPDGLGIIPYNTTIFGASDWCKPTITDASGATVPAPGASADERYAQLQGAVATLAAQAPNASVYLDGTHSSWLGVGEAAYRVHRAGFDPSTGASLVKGFFLDVSNYQPSDQLVQFGTWVSQCVEAVTAGASWALGHFDYCPSQFDPATNYTTVNYTPAFEATVTAGLANMLNGAVPTLSFVIDSGRNGQPPFDASAYGAPPFNQPAPVLSGLAAGSWCNRPGAGAGLRPTANTGVPLLDAYLWIKTPGESDGSCDIAGGARAWDYSAYDPWNITGDAQNHFDPLWGITDPAAGAWFPAQAQQLAQLAVPPLF